VKASSWDWGKFRFACSW